MNVLASFAHAQPALVDALVQAERVSFEQLIDATERADFPFALREAWDTLAGRDPVGRLLYDAYLPVIPSEYWRSRVGNAAPAEAPREGPVEPTEWVTFAPGGRSDHGLALPDDSDPRPTRVSLFVRAEDRPRRVSVEYADTAPAPTGVSRSEDTDGCSLPDWGECYGDDCGGDCELRRVYTDENGLICWCPHTS